MKYVTSLSGHDFAVFNTPATYDPTTGAVLMNGVDMYFINFSLSSFSGEITFPSPPTPNDYSSADVSKIIQQPISNANMGTTTTSAAAVYSNLTGLQQQENDTYIKSIESTQIATGSA